ncbi:MAG: ATP-binding protein [Steroidobacteraceae bacterium]
MEAAIADKLLQQAPDALLLINADGNIQFTNTAATALFGYQPEELLGQTMELLLPERHRGAHLQHRAGYVKHPTQRAMGQRGVALSGRRRDGSEFPIWVSLSPITVDGKLQIVAAIRDVTDWEQLMHHLRETSEEAKKASQIKSRFLATASHDLRQPLQALHLLTASLERKLTDTDLLSIVTRQQHAIDTMTELLNALLDISKLESGTVKVALEPVNAWQLLNEVRDQFESVVAAKNLALETQFANISLNTDRVLIRQLVHNLMGNAIKYTDQGRISLKLLHSPQETALEVTDTGIGIPRDQLAKIFDAYYQPHGSRPDRPGVGLGLAIVKQIAELLGYGIHVESQPGRGTTFRVTIPNEQVSSQMVATRSTPQSMETAAPEGQCILIIEDDHAVREAIALALELEGFVTLSASNEATAQSLYAEHGPGITAVVSDYHVDAHRTGVDIVKGLRASIGQRLPAVFLTGDTSLALRSQQDLPESRLLNKPVDIHRLVQALSELLH